MKLIVGLGNPEEKYLATRHNIGWRMVDALVERGGGSFTAKRKFKGLLAELHIDHHKVLVLKPTTYYNLSGEAVQAVAKFYAIAAEDVLLIHDELALPYGTVRARIGGSDAGNNGVKSINQLFNPGTARLRVGIWNDMRAHIPDADFVLSKLSSDEEKAFPELQASVLNIVDSFAAGNFQPRTIR